MASWTPSCTSLCTSTTSWLLSDLNIRNICGGKSIWLVCNCSNLASCCSIWPQSHWWGVNFISMSLSSSTPTSSSSFTCLWISTEKHTELNAKFKKLITIVLSTYLGNQRRTSFSSHLVFKLTANSELLQTVK